ncbi:acyltransferase [Agrobacterium sp. FDAARGOS_525]|uniref:acyltransferase n=1 Tax=Agrobacterium sp. FDAARGOS_525 TaxID=2420311 RepID=UPI000F6921FE|nr:acyltransferase [Agrobacterium sp. FDAARGOS_525]RSC31252.1 acyltransferase [Agrobacterium sp. FDAARGOS_525]
MAIDNRGQRNLVTIDDSLKVSGFIAGNDNIVIIEESSFPSSVELRICGDHNHVRIRKDSFLNNLRIFVGNQAPAKGAVISIGEYCSCEPNCQFFVYGSGDRLTIGNNCMLSNTITMRTSESPHLIFDLETGDYLDIGGNISIGDHVWVGERAYLTKKAVIGDENIVAACAVVTRSFKESNCVIGGNPAEVRRRGVQWIRNRSRIEPGSKFEKSHDAHREKWDQKKW